MIEVLTDFISELRRAGLPVSTQESIDAALAISQTPLDDQSELRSALAATLLKSAEHRDAFFSVFDIFFSLAQVPTALAPSDADDFASRSEMGATTAANSAPSVSSMGEDDVAAMIREAIATGDEQILRLAARLAVVAYAGIEAGRPVGVSYYLYRTLRALDLDSLVSSFAVSNDEVSIGTLGEMGDLGARLMAEEYASRIEMLRELIEGEITRALVADRGVDAVAASLRRTALGDVDFMHATRAELAQIRRALYPLARLLASRLARSRRHRSKGPLDFRATIRRSLSTGGVPIEPRFTHPHPAKPELVVIADISGSVASFARFTIQLVFAIASQFSRVNSFVFVDGLDEVTHIFRRSSSLTEAIQRVATEANVTHLDGHSNYGNAFSIFTASHLRQITSRTDVLVLGDARNNYHASRTDLFAEIARRSRHLYWLNPEPRAYWGSGDSIIEEYRPYCDEVFECRNLHQLEAFVSSLA